MELKRREFIKCGIASGLLLAAKGLTISGAQAQQKEFNISSIDTPVIDMHTHYPPYVKLETIIENFDKAGVEKAVVMARGGMSAQDTFDFYRKYPDRVIPFIPFQVKGWITQDPSFVVDAERSLKRGTFRGMGEVILRHYAVPEQGASEFDIKADGGMMLKIMELGAKYKLPILIHHEAEPETVSALEKMLIHAPANVVWGHAGRATADIVEYLLNKYPNLYCDTSALDRTRSYGVEKNPITDESNQLKEEWKSLFIRFPDRFMFGVDGVFPPHYNQFVYAKATMAQRAILAQLGPEVSKRIAYDNARRLLSV